MSFGGLSNLGGSVFTLKVDDEPLVAGLKKAEAAARHASNAIGNDLARGSKMATQGMLQLGYAVDDLQYGFSAIANNIPQIAMGFGAGAGLAGGIAIASTAVNQLIKHWGELSDMVKSNWSGNTTEQLAKIRDHVEKAAEAWEHLTKAHSQYETKGSKLVEEAILEEPGGAAGSAGRLAGAISNSALFNQGSTQAEKDQIKIAQAEIAAGKAKSDPGLVNRAQDRLNKIYVGMASKMLGGAAVAGEAGRIPRLQVEALVPGLGAKMREGEPEAVKRQEEFAKAAHARKEVEAKIKAADAAHLSKMEHEGATDKSFEHHKVELERRALEAEKKDLGEQIRRGEHVLTGEGKKQLQDKLLGGRAPEESKIMSVKSFADKMLTGGMNTVPQKQLDKLVDMHTTLKDIDKKLIALGLQ